MQGGHKSQRLSLPVSALITYENVKTRSTCPICETEAPRNSFANFVLIQGNLANVRAPRALKVVPFLVLYCLAFVTTLPAGGSSEARGGLCIESNA